MPKLDELFSRDGKQGPETALPGGIDLEAAADVVRDTILRNLRQEGLEDLPRDEVDRRIRQAIRARYPNLPTLAQERLWEALRKDLVGYGPIQPLLDNPEISEIIVIGPDKVYAESHGKLAFYPEIRFRSQQHLRDIIDRILASCGRSASEATPIVDARLPDGSRVHVDLPPVALDGPYLDIRKFHENMSVDRLIELGAMSRRLASFLEGMVKGRMTIVVSGGTGSGKTTLLNALSQWIPDDEAIITVEDTAELQLQQPNLRRMEARQANTEGQGAITIRDLVKASLRMRPDRVVVGEVRGGEALDAIQAANTGHDGLLMTVHANDPVMTLRRLETLCLMSDVELPQKAIREQIGSAVDLIVSTARLWDGSRKVIEVAEILGLEEGEYRIQTVYRFKQTGLSPERKIVGRWEVGVTAESFGHGEKLEMHGVKIDPAWFGEAGA